MKTNLNIKIKLIVYFKIIFSKSVSIFRKATVDNSNFQTIINYYSALNIKKLREELVHAKYLGTILGTIKDLRGE